MPGPKVITLSGFHCIWICFVAILFILSQWWAFVWMLRPYRPFGFTILVWGPNKWRHPYFQFLTLFSPLVLQFFYTAKLFIIGAKCAGSSINDVTQFWIIFDSQIVTSFKTKTYTVNWHHKTIHASSLGHDVIYGWPLNHFLSPQAWRHL